MQWIELDSTESTNTYLYGLISGGGSCVLPCAVLSAEQKSGAGRRGRTWSSNRGGMYLSYCPGRLEPDDAFVWPLAAACAVHEYLAGSTALDGFSIKWPNDIYHGDRKIAGILTKGVSGPGGFYIIVGIGLNIYNAVPLNGTVNLKELAPYWDRDIRDTAESILSHMDERPERHKTADYVNRYLWGKNETKTIRSGGAEFEALLRYVSCDLSLVMERPPGGDTVMMNIGEVL